MLRSFVFVVVCHCAFILSTLCLPCHPLLILVWDAGPDCLLPSLHYRLREYLKAFPGPLRDDVFPVCPWFAPRPSPDWAAPKWLAPLSTLMSISSTPISSQMTNPVILSLRERERGRPPCREKLFGEPMFPVLFSWVQSKANGHAVGMSQTVNC